MPVMYYETCLLYVYAYCMYMLFIKPMYLFQDRNLSMEDLLRYFSNSYFILHETFRSEVFKIAS